MRLTLVALVEAIVALGAGLALLLTSPGPTHRTDMTRLVFGPGDLPAVVAPEGRALGAPGEECVEPEHHRFRAAWFARC